MFLYKFSVRNEQEIRNDSPARSYFVAAESISDAVRGYEVVDCLLESVQFVAPIVVVPDCLPSSFSSSPSFPPNLKYHICGITYRTDDGLSSALVHAFDTSSAISHLCDFLGYTPEIVQSSMIEDLIL